MEDLKPNQHLMRPVTANDIEVKLEVKAEFWNENGFAKTIWSNQYLAARVGALLGMDKKYDPMR